MTSSLDIVLCISPEDARGYKGALIDGVGALAPSIPAAVANAQLVRGWIGVFSPNAISGDFGALNLAPGFEIPWHQNGRSKGGEGRPAEFLSVLSRKRGLSHYLQRGPWVLEEPGGASRPLSHALQFVTSFTSPGDRLLCFGDFHGEMALACRLLERDCTVVEPLGKQHEVIRRRVAGAAWKAYDAECAAKWAPNRFNDGHAIVLDDDGRPTCVTDESLQERWDHWGEDLRTLNTQVRKLWLEQAAAAPPRARISLSAMRPLIHLEDEHR